MGAGAPGLVRLEQTCKSAAGNLLLCPAAKPALCRPCCALLLCWPAHVLIYACRGLMSLQDDATAESGQALQAAGIKLGTDVLLQLSGLVRGGRDSVHAECKVDPAAEQLSLRKVRRWGAY